MGARHEATNNRAFPALAVVTAAVTAAAVSAATAAGGERAVPTSSDPVAASAAPPATTEPPLPGRLSETGLYAAGTTAIAPQNLPFSPQYPLWSDGAAKRRWISIPRGAVIDGTRPDAWEFPVGTRFWKEFAFGGARVETRMIERLPDGRYRYAAYVWDEALGDAILAPEGGLLGVAALPGDARHDIPSRDDCRTCHEGRRSPILGFGALQLSPDRDPLAPHREAVPAGAVDLPELVRRGLLVGFPASLIDRPPRIGAASAEGRAAAGYLFGNCAHCHNADGPLAPLSLDLDQSVLDADGEARLARATNRGSRFRFPDAGATDRVTAGLPDASVLALRMQTRDLGAQMPPLGTRLVDDEAARLVEAWISGLDPRARVTKGKDL